MHARFLNQYPRGCGDMHSHQPAGQLRLPATAQDAHRIPPLHRYTLFLLPFGGTYPQLAEKIEEYHQIVNQVHSLVQIGEKIKRENDLLT